MKNIQFGAVIFVFLASACGGEAPPNDYYPEEPQAAPAIQTDNYLPTPAMMPVNSPRPDVPVTVRTDTPEAIPSYASPIPTLFTSPYTEDMISPIFYGSYPNFLLLGATSFGRWIQPEEIYGLLYNDGIYDFYFLGEYRGTGSARIEEPVYFGPPGYCNYISPKLTGMGGSPPTLGLKHGQPIALRPVEDIPVDTALYLDAAREWLLLQDVPNPTVNITRIVRTDLEGDGIDEVLLSASFFLEETGHNVVAGDYSVVLMRKAIGGEVYTTPLIQDIYYEATPILKFPAIYYLDNVYDLNGDGRSEVIVTSRWWEGSGYFVYEIHGLNPLQVLKLSCSL
ncbi:MAG: hypothetical protein KPEEDBHJ_01678 [Anaerolineales bacterium]|nr:hypothetical protein [Anaerolineales bacterium]